MAGTTKFSPVANPPAFRTILEIQRADKVANYKGF